MSSFVKAQGICFLFGDELPASDLSSILCKIANFLQDVAPYAKLQRYDDWWEHDGLQFHRGSTDFDALYRMVNSPKNLLESTPDDDSVFVGVAPDNNAWYLRYRVEWDDEETNLVGSCAVVLPKPLTEKFRAEVLANLNVKAEEKDSEVYYQEVVL